MPNITLLVWNWEASPCFSFQMRCNCNKFRLKSFGSTQKRSQVGPSWAPICGVDLIDTFICSFHDDAADRRKTLLLCSLVHSSRGCWGKGIFCFQLGCGIESKGMFKFYIIFLNNSYF